MVLASSSLRQEFTERLRNVRAGSSAVTADAVSGEVASVLGQHGVTAWTAAPDVPAEWLPSGATAVDTFLTLARQTDHGRLGCVEPGLLGVAETGSVLTIGAPAARRLAMLADVQVLMLRERDLVPTLDEAAIRISAMHPAPPYLSFVTGASRSSDIERTLAIGVHGPAVLHVVLIPG